MALLWSVSPSAALAADTAEAVFVEVASAKLRKEPLHWAQPVQDVGYGVRLTVISRDRSWILVRGDRGTGYIHQSAVTTRKILMQGADSKALLSTTDTDVVLAGKGFSKEIESLYSSQNPELDMAAVDRLERLKVDPGSLHRFMRQGELNEAGVG